MSSRRVVQTGFPRTDTVRHICSFCLFRSAALSSFDAAGWVRVSIGRHPGRAFTAACMA
jgi:hypothetical protein